MRIAKARTTTQKHYRISKICAVNENENGINDIEYQKERERFRQTGRQTDRERYGEGVFLRTQTYILYQLLYYTCTWIIYTLTNSPKQQQLTIHASQDSRMCRMLGPQKWEPISSREFPNLFETNL